MDDKRFSHIINDPKFRHIPKGARKIKIDKRFESMFKDKRFNVKYTVDKRGRPVNHTSKEDLKRYYELSSESSESEEENDQSFGKYVRAPTVDNSEISKDESKKTKNTVKKNHEKLNVSDNVELNKHVTKEKVNTSKDKDSKSKNKKQESSEEVINRESINVEGSENCDLNNVTKFDKQVSDEVKKKLKNLNIDYARGESRLFSDSSSDDESDDELSDEDTIEHKWGELDADADATEEATSRLAACNMDWDRIRAIDLMVLFNSFLPPQGLVKSVVIYPSEFGKQRIEEEEVKGPIELVESDKPIENEDETEEGSKYHMEKLRKYQLNRLKYYYAVITFNSAETANKVYTDCDGMEYESSATKLDLRFIPDDMTFDDKPKEVCDKLPDLTKYQPRFFTTTALQQAKVDLTWDETNPDRLEITQKLNSGKLDNIEDTDLQNYLASSSGEEESDSESQNDGNNSDQGSSDPICKYRALLQEIEEKEKKKKEKDIQMEVYWDVGLEKRSEQLVQKKLEEKEEKTPFQQYLEKRKQKRKEKRDNKKKSDKNTSDESDSDIPDGIDMNDPYFAEEFNKAEFKNKSKHKKEVDKEDKTAEQDNAELALLLMDEDDNKKHFSLKKIQEQENTKKNKKKQKRKKGSDVVGDDFTINVSDKRFSALFTSNHFNIDPTDPNFKKTKAMETLIQEKLKRGSDSTEGSVEKKVKVSREKNPEISALVKTTKQKLLKCKQNS